VNIQQVTSKSKVSSICIVRYYKEPHL